ncbi:hypothetical protein ACHAXT_002001 [Thalassiosira profunda]
MSGSDADGVIAGLSALTLGEDWDVGRDDEDDDSVPGYSRVSEGSLGCSEDADYQVHLSNYTRMLELLMAYAEGNYMVLWEFQNLCKDTYSGPMFDRCTMYGLEGLPWFHMRLGTWDDEAFVHGDDFSKCPTWGKFCDALQLWPGEPLRGVSVNNVKMSQQFLAGIGPLLKRGWNLAFERCILGKQGLKYLADHLDGNQYLASMRYMCRGGEEMKDIGGVKRFFDVLRRTPIRDFSLGSSLRNEDPEVLSIIMDGVKDVRKLSFCWLTCPSEGHRIASVLAENPGVESIMVGCNSFGPSDAIKFANALSTNTNLKSLELSIEDNFFDPNSFERFSIDDGITKEMGRDAVLKAVYNPDSLNSIRGCNHTCSVLVFGMMTSFHEEVKSMVDSGCSVDEIIKHKLLQALGGHRKQSLNMEHLYGLEPELLPLLQAATSKRIALGNVYRVLKECLVPSVF